MFLSNPVKIFHAVCVISMIFSGCSLWRRDGEAPVASDTDTKSEYPFPTREPDVFQTKIVIRSGGTERRIFLARDHDRRRIDFDVDTDDHRAVVFGEKHYLLFFKRKTYSEQARGSNEGDSGSLYSPMINRRDYSEFEEVDRVGSTIEFRARINESAVSEVSIFFDEKIGLPVRQEFYSIEGNERTLRYLFELYEFSTSVDAALFQVPADFRKVSQTVRNR